MIDTMLKNKTALVTGGDSGIGKSIAKAFLAQGANVILSYLTSPIEIENKFMAHYDVPGKKGIDSFLKELSYEYKDKVYAVEADLSKANSAKLIFEEISTKFKPVDILVNNAAHTEIPDDLYNTTAGHIDRHFNVNVRSSVLLIAEFVKRIERRKSSFGRIINISSNAARVLPTQISYAASKYAMESYTRSIAFEIGHLGITINTIEPGPIQTGSISNKLEDKLLPWIPMNRLGYPEDIADSVIFLASHQARWITGEVIKVSGGHNC